MQRSTPLLALTALLLPGALRAQEHNAPAEAQAPKVLHEQTTCPIRGEALKDRKTFVDYEGQRIYFCCPMCIKKFREFPDAALWKMYQDGVRPESIQTACPVTGEELENRDNYVDVLNKRIYVCCPKCVKKVAADPAKYLDQLEGRKPQTACPVSGEPVDGKTTAVVQGQKVGFCCPGCDKKMEAEPEKFFAAIAARHEVTEPATALCPVMGDPVESKEFSVTWQGRRYYFCCEKCIGKFVKDPARYVAKL